MGVELLFLNEPYINSNVYKEALSIDLPYTNTDADAIIDGIKVYLKRVADRQIRTVFEQAEKELMDIRKRTKDGVLTARLKGKQIGRPGGRTYTTQKFKNVRDTILKKSKSFGGTYTDIDLAELCKIDIKTLYKYKKMLKNEIEGQ